MIDLDEIKAMRWWVNVLIAAGLVMAAWVAWTLIAGRRAQLLQPLTPAEEHDQAEAD